MKRSSTEPAIAPTSRVIDRRLRAKTLKVARLLERFLGVPRQSKRLPRPLDMLIATILSQNTNDKNSHRAYTSLRSRYRTWEDVAKAPTQSLKAAIRMGGMANQKAPRIKGVLEDIFASYGEYDLTPLADKGDDEVIQELTLLDGVGLKTASCVLLFSMGRDVFPVDTHVHRICGRLGMARGCTTPDKTFEAMKPLVPEGKGYSFHTNLIRFGRRVCRSTNPSCDICPLYGECEYEGKSNAARPRTPSRADHNFMLLDNVQVGT